MRQTGLNARIGDATPGIQLLSFAIVGGVPTPPNAIRAFGVDLDECQKRIHR